ncbi:MAG: PHP domain-containing protein, partial [Actinomycetes bacterium]
MRIDLHTHSSVSDGTDRPAALVEAARAAGLDVVALTDHDTFDGLDEAGVAGQRLGVQVVRGVELSCSRSGQSVHLLGYGVEESDESLRAEMSAIREGRSDRLAPVLAKLTALGLPLTPAQVRAHVGRSPSVGRPHIADAMVAAGYVRDRTEAFDRFLADGGPAHVPRYTVDLETGIDLIHRAGGVAVV